MPTSNLSSVEPDFSPDGSKIVFRQDIDPGAPFVEDILVMNADGSSPIDITGAANQDSFEPQWEYV